MGVRAHDAGAGSGVAAVLVFGVSCWHLLRGRNQELFLRAAKLSLIVLVPVSALNLWFGSSFRIVVTEQQPMKILDRGAVGHLPTVRLQLARSVASRRTTRRPRSRFRSTRLLSFLATGSFNGRVVGMNELQAQETADYGPGDYIPPVRATYWGMRIMAYLGTLVFLVAALGLPVPARAARADALVPVDGRRDDRGALPRRALAAGCSRRSDGSRGSSRACSRPPMRRRRT